MLLLSIRPKRIAYTVDPGNSLIAASTFVTLFYVCRIFAIGMSI